MSKKRSLPKIKAETLRVIQSANDEMTELKARYAEAESRFNLNVLLSIKDVNQSPQKSRLCVACGTVLPNEFGSCPTCNRNQK
jgi:hypothetical protein